MINTITGNKDFIEFYRGKKATFLLALSNTKTNEIPNLIQTTSSELNHLISTINSEFLCLGEVRSIQDDKNYLKYVQTSALITRAVHTLNPYSNIEILNLGLQVKPKLSYFKTYDFDMKESRRIDDGANINALEVFQKAITFAQKFECKDDYIILGESVLAGTTTAKATALALGYDVQDKFSSSFSNESNDIKQSTITKALSRINKNDDVFSILGKVSDNMLIFTAGFILGLNNKIPIILAGGTQMACVLLIVNSILKQMDGRIESSNLCLCTTTHKNDNKNSNLKSIINMCDFKVNSYYANFDFSLSNHPTLKLYNQDEVKDTTAAGASLVYGYLNGLTQEQITLRVEELLT